MAEISCMNCGAEGEANFSTNYFGELVCELCGTQSYMQTRTETQDAEDMGLDLTAIQKMRRRTKRKKRERKIKIIEEKQPVQLLDCIVATQFMLNEQAEALVKIGFPAEYPRIVKDVWFHFLNMWPTKGARPLLRCFTEFHYARRPEDKAMDPVVTSDVLEQWDAENARHIERLFQPSSSTPQKEAVEERKPRRHADGIKNAALRHWQHSLDWFVMPDMVAMLVIAGRMLNLGVVPCDYIHWIECGDLPYYNLLSLCPIAVQESIERVTVFFEPTIRSNMISSAHLAYKTHYLQFHLEIKLPPLNASAVAYTICQNLQFPAQVFRNFQWITAHFNIPGNLPEKPVQQSMASHKQDKAGSALDSAVGIAACLLVALRLCPNWTEWIYENAESRECHVPPYNQVDADRLPRRELSAFVAHCEDVFIHSGHGRIPKDFSSHVDDLKARFDEAISSGRRQRHAFRNHTLRGYPAVHEDGICVETPDEIECRVDEIKQRLDNSREEKKYAGQDESEQAPVTFFYPVYSHFERDSFHAQWEAALELVAEYIDVPMGLILRWTDVIDRDLRKLSISFLNDATGSTRLVAAVQATRRAKGLPATPAAADEDEDS